MPQKKSLQNKEIEKPGTVIYENNTFIVRILYRCNASWQGEIIWLEGKRQKKFRSLLELVMLIQEAMPEKERAETDCKLKTVEGSK